MDTNMNDETGKTEEMAVAFLKVRYQVHLDGPRDELQ
jgi:hypothetical protein